MCAGFQSSNRRTATEVSGGQVLPLLACAAIVDQKRWRTAPSGFAMYCQWVRAPLATGGGSGSMLR